MSSESSPSPEGLWQRFLQAIEPKLSAHVLANWLRPVRCISIDGDLVVLEVRDDFSRNWLNDHYLDFVRDHLEGLLNRPLDVRLTTAAPRGPLAAGAANHDVPPDALAANADAAHRVVCLDVLAK